MSLEPYNKEGMKRKKGHDSICDCDLMPSYTKKKARSRRRRGWRSLFHLNVAKWHSVYT